MGSIFNDGHNGVKYRVASFKELAIIEEFLDKFTLITQKQADFILFKQAMKLIKNKAHLTSKGLKEIVNIRAAMNKGLSDTLIKEFSDHVAKVRPLIQNSKILVGGALPID